jgi:predicted  nucleic acid-binding Zn-ribbon protein
MFGRRRRSENHPIASALAQAQRAALATAASEALTAEADRIERAVKALAVHAHELEQRVGNLETRLADVERRATESLPLMVAARLHVVGAEIEGTAVAAEAAELLGELADADGYVMADQLASQIAGLADSLDALAATLAASSATTAATPLRALPPAS